MIVSPVLFKKTLITVHCAHTYTYFVIKKCLHFKNSLTREFYLFKKVIITETK